MDVTEFRNIIVRQGMEGALIQLAEATAALEVRVSALDAQTRTVGEQKIENKTEPEPTPFGEQPQRDPAAPRQEEHRNG